MNPHPLPTRNAKIRGFALVTAIFLLVVLAALGAFIVNISATQSITSAQDLRGSRAYHAAQAGLEWGLYQVLDPLNTTTAVTVPVAGPPLLPPPDARWPNMPPCPASPTALVIDQFTVTVTCTRLPAGAAGVSGPPVYTENGTVNSVIIYELVSVARATGAAVGTLDFVERQVQATVSKCRATDAPPPGYECP